MEPCTINYEQMWVDLREGRITKTEFDEVYNANCAHCKWMYETCMYGEDEPTVEEEF